MESWWSALALLAGFAIAGVWLVGRNGTWFDESYTRVLVARSFGEITRLTAVDSHPPLWYWALKLWTVVAGSSLVEVRAFSLVCMTASLAVFYVFVRRRFTPGVALLGLGLVALNPTIFHYSCDGRMYAFALLLVACSTLVIDLPYTRGRAIAYWVLAVVMLYTHYFLTFIVAAHMLFLLLTRAERGWRVWQVFAYGASIVVAFLPWISVLLGRINYTAQNGFWIGPFSPNTLFQYFTETFLRRSDSDLHGWRAILALVFVVTFVVALVRTTRAPRPVHASLLWCVFAVPPVVLILISIKTPLFYPRYVIFGLPSLCALAAIGAIAMTSWRRIAVVVILLVGTTAGFARELPYTTFRMPNTAAELDKPVDGELPPVLVVWYFAFLDAKTTLAHPERVFELRNDPPKCVVNEALYCTQRDWWVKSTDELPSSRYVWTIEDAGGEWGGKPASWVEIKSVRRGYTRARLFRRGP